MTTFDFSIHKAPPGRKWHEQFTNDPSGKPTALTGSLGAYGIHGWNGFDAYGEWIRKERLKRYRPDWCLHVAKCSRGQLNRFADTCLRRNLCGPAEHAAFLRLIESLPGSSFVIEIEEF